MFQASDPLERKQRNCKTARQEQEQERNEIAKLLAENSGRLCLLIKIFDTYRLNTVHPARAHLITFSPFPSPWLCFYALVTFL